MVITLTTMVGMAVAQETSRLYLAGYLGLNIYKDQSFHETTRPADGSLTFKNGGSFAGALGIRLNRNLRLEGELAYRSAQVDSAHFNGVTAHPGGRDKAYFAMANLYYDFNLNWKSITPFVMGGVGVASHDFDTDGGSGLPSVNGRSTGFAYQAGAGLAYRVSPSLSFTGDYRFVGSSDINVDSYKSDYHAHEFRLGLRYDLPVNFMK